MDVARFFADVLGWTVSGDPAAGYAEVDAGGQRIALHRGALVDEAVTPHGGTLLQTTCEDARAEAAAVRSRGGELLLEPTATDWGSVVAYVRGPHGVLVELSSPA